MLATEYFNYFSENVDSFLRRKKEWHGLIVLILIIILKKFDNFFGKLFLVRFLISHSEFFIKF